MTSPGIIRFNRRRPSPAVIAHLARWLRGGQPVVIPTETRYALAADATSLRALAAVRALKGRRPGAPFSVFLLGGDSLADWSIRATPAARALAAEFWPGPLTLILRTSNPLFRRLGASGTVGIRVSPEPVVQRLVRLLERPLLATSANPSGAALSPDAENRWLAQEAAAGRILWARPLRYRRRAASTIVDCTKASPVQLRAGPVRLSQWRAHLRHDTRGCSR